MKNSYKHAQKESKQQQPPPPRIIINEDYVALT